jgi:hypothetical protein
VSNYRWSAAYQRAETEQNVFELHDCVMAVENAIFIRMQELTAVKHPDEEVQTELQELRASVKGLLRIKTEKLKWPGLDLNTTQSDSAN